jgi:hypothetical protein
VRQARRWSIRNALPIAVLVLASCSGETLKLYAVRGTVFYLDQPAEGATVVFHPASGSSESPLPSGTVKADGSFILRTHPHGDGAPAGDYVVLVTWYPTNARELENPKNRLPDRYARHAESPFRVIVKQGPNELEPFRLTN